MQGILWVPMLVISLAELSYLHSEGVGRNVSNVRILFIKPDEHFNLVLPQPGKLSYLPLHDCPAPDLFDPVHFLHFFFKALQLDGLQVSPLFLGPRNLHSNFVHLLAPSFFFQLCSQFRFRVG